MSRWGSSGKKVNPVAFGESVATDDPENDYFEPVEEAKAKARTGAAAEADSKGRGKSPVMKLGRTCLDLLRRAMTQYVEGSSRKTFY